MAEQFSNFHTHTCLCDGKDRPEDLVQEALRLGCPALGFSGHAYAPYDGDYCMSPAGTEEYKTAIRRLQEKYAGQIRIYLGIEQDFYSPASTEGYDYVIGSVHYLYKDGEYLPVDASRAAQEQAVQQHYGGDWYAFTEDYFDTLTRVYEKTRCRVVGHFDLVTKFNEGNKFFDEEDPRYLRPALETLEYLLPLWYLKSIPAPSPGATARSPILPGGSWRSCAAGASSASSHPTATAGRTCSLASRSTPLGWTEPSPFAAP